MGDLTGLRLSELTRLGSLLRAAGTDAGSLEVAAQRIVRTLYDELRTDGDRSCVLVRFYKTHPYGSLDPELQSFARGLMGTAELTDVTPCLTLLGTAGDLPEWNDRRRSQRHQAVPLPSESVIEALPMIAQLIRQFGLSTGALVDPDPGLIVELDEKTYNVFYVGEADGSPYVPAQDFVAEFGVRSAVGFGGVLPTGDLFATVLFSRVPVPRETAELLAILALSVKLALLPWADGPLMQGEAGTPQVLSAVAASRSHVRALEQLLEVHERTVQEQSVRREQLHTLEQRRSRQLHLLAEVSVAIGSMTSTSDILDHVNERGREVIGAHQAVASLNAGADWAQAITSVSMSERYADWRDYDAVPDGSGIYSLVCETNAPLRLTQAELEAHPRWRGFGGEAPAHPAMNGWLAVPLVSRNGSNLGLLQLSDPYEGEFTAEDEAVLVQLARLASVSIDNARSYDREHRVAVALQQSLLPTVAGARGLDTSSRYLPASHELGVGGDWYDVFEIGAGRVALVVGDVVGHDVRAARTMGQLRHAIRAFAFEDPSPAAVLTRLDRFLDVVGSEEFATVLYLTVDHRTGAVTYTNAGHPPPLVLAPQQPPEFWPMTASPPAGYLAPFAYEEEHVMLPPGATLLFYTDGLIERRGASLTDGMDRLVEFAASAPPAPDQLLDALEAWLADEDLDDDIAMLAFRRPGAG